MGHVPPPYEHIGRDKDFLRQTMLRIVKSDRLNLSSVSKILPEALSNSPVHTLRIPLCDTRLCLFMTVFTPYGETQWPREDHGWFRLGGGHHGFRRHFCAQSPWSSCTAA